MFLIEILKRKFADSTKNNTENNELRLCAWNAFTKLDSTLTHRSPAHIAARHHGNNSAIWKVFLDHAKFIDSLSISKEQCYHEANSYLHSLRDGFGFSAMEYAECTNETHGCANKLVKWSKLQRITYPTSTFKSDINNDTNQANLSLPFFKPIHHVSNSQSCNTSDENKTAFQKFGEIYGLLNDLRLDKTKTKTTSQIGNRCINTNEFRTDVLELITEAYAINSSTTLNAMLALIDLNRPGIQIPFLNYYDKIDDH